MLINNCYNFPISKSKVVTLFKESVRHKHSETNILNSKSGFEAITWKYRNLKLKIEYFGAYRAIEVHGIFKIKETTENNTLIIYYIRYPITLIITFIVLVLGYIILAISILKRILPLIGRINDLFNPVYGKEISLITIPLAFFILILIYSRNILPKAEMNIRNNFETYFSEYIG